MTTRVALYKQLSRRLGGMSGTIASGGANSAVLTNLREFSGDDSRFRGWTLWMPDADTAADQSRVIENWDDSEGEAHWVRDRADTSIAGEEFALFPPGVFQKARWDILLQDVLRRTKRATWTMIPTITDERLYPLSRDREWIKNPSDVLDVWVRSSPNLLDNSEFSMWQNGTAGAPGLWWEPTTATILRMWISTSGFSPTGWGHGRNWLRLTGNAGTASIKHYLDPQLVVQLQGTAVTFEVDCISSATSPIIKIGDSAGSTSSAAHSGGGLKETLTVTHTINASATYAYFELNSGTGDAADFSHAVANEGSSINSDLSTNGDDAWSRGHIPYNIVQHGPDDVQLELAHPIGRGRQLVVSALQWVFPVTSDTEDIDCRDEVMREGLLYEIARTRQESERSPYWDAIAREAGRAYSRYTSQDTRRDPAPIRPVVIRSA